MLGIDPGSRNLGWGVVERLGSRYVHLASGTFSARQAEFLPRMCGLVAALEQVLVDWAPQVCAVETAFAGLNVHSALVLGQARGAILVAVGRRGVPVVEYTPGQIKQATTGRGQADKHQVQGMVRMLLGLHDQELGLDTTDALACALCHAQQSTWSPISAARAKPLRRRRTAAKQGPSA